MARLSFPWKLPLQWARALRRMTGRQRAIPSGRRPLSLEPLEDRLALAGGVQVGFQVTSDWGSGFGAAMTLTNSSAAPVNGWRLEFDFDRSINQIWNARVVSHVGTRYVLQDAAYNKDIGIGGVTSFGFNGSAGNVTSRPTNILVNGVPMGAAPPTLPALAISDATVTEASGAAASFTVTLARASAQSVSVRYATSAGTAAAGADFTATTGTLTFAPGETQKTVRVSIADDTAVEPDETFTLLLSDAAGATLADAEGLGTIRDNDVAPPPTPPPPPPTPGTGAGPFNYGEALQKALFFYEANRSGDLPDQYRVSWRGDSALTDGADVGLDLSGGYYDAGDHVKFALPMASSMTLLAWGLLQYQDAYAASGQLDRVRESIRWGTDWLMKAHPSANVFYAQVGNGALDHAAWVAPEVMTMARPSYKLDPTRPGSDAAGEAAAALAAAAVAFRASDPAYAEQLLRHARELFNFADTYRGKYSDSIPDAANYYNSYSGYHDELVWAAAWLYRATGERAYLDKAEAGYAQNFAGQTMTWTHSWDDKRYGASILLAGMTGKTVYRTDAERYLDYWSVGINGGATRITYTPGGLAFLNGWGSLRYASTTAFMALLYADTVRDVGTRYRDFARGQINYILGANPRASSYLVGFGANPPVNPHHRGASGVWDGNVANAAPNRHVLYGALVGGPESANDFNYHDVRSNYISNEVALDYNAGFTGALARLYRDYGGAPLASIPTETKGDEFFVEASVNQTGPTFTEIRGLLNNRSAWPARLSSNLSFRYFVDLREVYAAGYSVADVTIASNYSQGARVSGLQPWDAARHIYYAEVSFAGVTIGPGAGAFQKEAQLRVGLRAGLPASAWDPTNDWSYQGLLFGRDATRLTQFLPVFEFGATKLFGMLPGAQALPGTPPPSGGGATTPPPPTAATTAKLTVRDDWGAGFVADITITNTSATTISNWILEFNLDRNITSIWNAEIVSRVGTRYVIRAKSYNGTLAPGQSVTVGFQGELGNLTGDLANVLLRSAPA